MWLELAFPEPEDGRYTWYEPPQFYDARRRWMLNRAVLCQDTWETLSLMAAILRKIQTPDQDCVAEAAMPTLDRGAWWPVHSRLIPAYARLWLDGGVALARLEDTPAGIRVAAVADYLHAATTYGTERTRAKVRPHFRNARVTDGRSPADAVLRSVSVERLSVVESVMRVALPSVPLRIEQRKVWLPRGETLGAAQTREPGVYRGLVALLETAMWLTRTSSRRRAEVLVVDSGGPLPWIPQWPRSGAYGAGLLLTPYPRLLPSDAAQPLRRSRRYPYTDTGPVFM